MDNVDTSELKKYLEQKGTLALAMLRHEAKKIDDIVTLRVIDLILKERDEGKKQIMGNFDYGVHHG